MLWPRGKNDDVANPGSRTHSCCARTLRQHSVESINAVGLRLGSTAGSCWVVLWPEPLQPLSTGVMRIVHAKDVLKQRSNGTSSKGGLFRLPLVCEQQSTEYSGGVVNLHPLPAVVSRYDVVGPPRFQDNITPCSYQSPCIHFVPQFFSTTPVRFANVSDITLSPLTLAASTHRLPSNTQSVQSVDELWAILDISEKSDCPKSA